MKKGRNPLKSNNNSLLYNAFSRNYYTRETKYINQYIDYF